MDFATYGANDGDEIAPYNASDPTNEPRPHHVVYQKPFARLLTQLNRIIDVLHGPLRSSKYQNASTEILLEETGKLQKEKKTEETLFAVSGDMGLGKSSLINSLLSIPPVAKSGASGDSCTWVVQRFMKAFPGQSSPFAARVYLCSLEEIRKTITSLLTKYMRAVERSKQDDDDDDNSDYDAADTFTEKNAVLESFKALYGDKKPFVVIETAEKYLSKARSDDHEAVLEELVAWAQELAVGRLGGKDYIELQGVTANELLYFLQPYTYHLGSDEDDDLVSPWPLVTVVDFGVNNTLLNDGIVLVDTPGLSDSDSTRAKNATMYSRQCTHMITIADVARAKNDKSIRDSLQKGFRLRGSTGTLLVLTKGDIMDGETRVRGDPLLMEKELQLKKEIDIIGAQRDKLAEKKRAIERREDRFRVDDELKHTSSALREKGLEYDRVRAVMRNKSVADALTDQYHAMTQDPDPLQVFVVGNSAYSRHRVGHPVENRPFLSVEETGIPALRARILALPAEGKFNDAMHMAEVQLPSLINTFELYCSKTYMARQKEIEALILQPLEDLKAFHDTIADKLMVQVKVHILDMMKAAEDNWVQEVKRLIRRWAFDHRTDGLSIMRQEGRKRGNKKRPDISWNNDLLQCGKSFLEHGFRELHAAIRPIFGEVSEELNKAVDATRAKVRGNPEFNVMALRPFLDAFKTERADVHKKIEKALRALQQAATFIEEDTTKASATAYLVEAMSPIYADVVNIKGKGAPKRRMDAFQKKVARMGGVWMKVHDGIQASFENAILESKQTIEEITNETFGSFHRKFKVLSDESMIKDPAEKLKEEKLLKTLKAQVQEAKKLLNGPLANAVAECRKWKIADGTVPVPK